MWDGWCRDWAGAGTCEVVGGGIMLFALKKMFNKNINIISNLYYFLFHAISKSINFHSVHFILVL